MENIYIMYKIYIVHLFKITRNDITLPSDLRKRVLKLDNKFAASSSPFISKRRNRQCVSSMKAKKKGTT